MSEKNELVSFMKRQVDVEKEIMASLNKGLRDIGNPAVKGVLRGVSLDSMKHAELYSAAITLLTESSRALTQENLDEAELLVKISLTMPSVNMPLRWCCFKTILTRMPGFDLASLLIRSHF